jgi:hypothetical protein
MAAVIAAARQRGKLAVVHIGSLQDARTPSKPALTVWHTCLLILDPMQNLPRS